MKRKLRLIRYQWNEFLFVDGKLEIQRTDPFPVTERDILSALGAKIKREDFDVMELNIDRMNPDQRRRFKYERQSLHHQPIDLTLPGNIPQGFKRSSF